VMLLCSHKWQHQEVHWKSSPWLISVSSSMSTRDKKRKKEDDEPPSIKKEKGAPSAPPTAHPFKNPHYTRKNENKKRAWKNLKQILAMENFSNVPPDVATYVSIEASPSVQPAKKYCDITGLPAPYRDPKTGLRYASSDIYKIIRQLSDEHVQQYLGLRGAAVVLK